MAQVIYTVFVVTGLVGGLSAFGVDIWTISPETLTFGLKVRDPYSPDLRPEA